MVYVFEHGDTAQKTRPFLCVQGKLAGDNLTVVVCHLPSRGHDNIYREDVLYFTAMAAYKYAYYSVPEKQRERYMTFLDDYYNFVSEYPQSKYKAELDGLYKKVSKIVKKDN